MNKEIELMKTISKLTGLPVEKLNDLYCAIEENNKLANVFIEFTGKPLKTFSFCDAVINKVKEKENK